MRQKGRMEMNAMLVFYRFSILFILVHVSHLRQYQIARYNVVQNCTQYSTPKTLIFERKCHSVADLRERSPPPGGGGGAVADFQ